MNIKVEFGEQVAYIFITSIISVNYIENMEFVKICEMI